MAGQMNFQSVVWDHHRSGWKYVWHELKKSPLHCDGAKVTCYGYGDGLFYNKKIIEHPWAAFLHNTPYSPRQYEEKYRNSYDLDKLLNLSLFKKSQSQCIGIYTLSEYTREFVQQRLGKDFLVESLCHPLELCETQFSYDEFAINPNKRIVMIGHWLRRLHSIYNIPTKRYSKLLLKPSSNSDNDYMTMAKYITRDCDRVSIMDRLPNDEYDDLLRRNLVFIDLYDAGANNVIVECIARSTPILVNRLPATEEYLGSTYPLFYKDLEHAAGLAEDLFQVRKAAEYLRDMDKTKFGISTFIQSIERSNIYRQAMRMQLTIA